MSRQPLDSPLLLQRIDAVINGLFDRLDQRLDLELTCRNVTKRFRTTSQSRSLTSIILVLSHCRSLYPRTATTREVYYFFITHFKSQRECDLAIADACVVLGNLPRHRLGLHASSRGWFAGPMTIVGKETAANYWEPRPITADWLRQFPLQVEASSARCILIVEKEGIFQRILEDGGIPGCIFITGKGFPDLATRAAVWTLYLRLRLPIFGLADCDAFGVSVLHTYHTPPVDDPETEHEEMVEGELPIQWLGLRPSQWKNLDLPDAVFQELTKRDQQRLETLLSEAHPFCAYGDDPSARETELQAMMETKVELEALHWLGMDFCTTFVTELVESNLALADSSTSIEDDPWKKAL